MTNPSQQIPIASSMISPPPSPIKYSNVIPSTMVCENLSTDAVGDTEKQATSASQPPQPEKITNPKSKFRMFVSDIPPELLDLIKNSEIKSKKPNEVKINTSNASKSKSSSKIHHHHHHHHHHHPHHHGHVNHHNSHRIDIRTSHHRPRKNPYPVKSPSKTSPGITLKLDVFTPFKENPMALLRSGNPPPPPPLTSSGCSTPSLASLSSSSESTPPSSPNLSVQKKQRKRHIKTKNSKIPIVERKRKSNSLSRVMADRGLLEASFNTTNSGEIKSIRLPPPPPMEWEKLFENINNMHLDMEILNDITPKITWKGQPLSISHLPHFNALHPKEIMVASTLRLTPVQYLTAKNTLVSAAQRYVQRSLPFRKSDAQKLLRIDVNKASKLWEFFQQVKWI